MKCRTCKEPTRVEIRTHHYTESGLENVWVEGVKVYVCPHGHEMVSIPAMDKLHGAIARALVQRGERLSAAEIRFLREYLGLSNQDMAGALGVSEGQASRWASGAATMAESAERLLRVLTLGKLTPAGAGLKYLRRLGALHEAQGARDLKLAKSPTGWRASA